MAAFAPEEDEFRKLRTKIIKVIGKETTAEFDDTLDYLITFLRNKAFIHASTPSATKMQKELSDLVKQLKKVQSLLDSGLDQMTEMHVTYALIKKMSDTGCEDPLYATHYNAGLAIEVCEEAQSKIKGKRPEFTPSHMRQILAEELARELDKIGIEPKKYRDGDFINILRAVLIMIPCQVHGKKISISIPDDLFQVACDAIDAFPTKEPYSLLSFE